MPPLAKCLVVVLLVAWPAALSAQTPASGDANMRRPQTPPSSYIAPVEARNQAPPPRREAPTSWATHGRASPTDASKAFDKLPNLGPMASGLAMVLGLFLVVAWVLRRAGPKGATLLPSAVVEVLGRAPLAGRQQMHLLRCGNKLLLVSVTPTGAETLTEVTDPLEVDRLAGLCRQAHPQSATAAFRQVFQQFGTRSEGRHA